MSKIKFVTISVIECILLLACLLDMPYGYYSVVRFGSMCIFAYLGVAFSSKHKSDIRYFFYVLALLFQPFFKIALGRTLWNIVDVVVAIILVFMMLNYKEDEN